MLLIKLQTLLMLSLKFEIFIEISSPIPALVSNMSCSTVKKNYFLQKIVNMRSELCSSIWSELSRNILIHVNRVFKTGCQFFVTEKNSDKLVTISILPSGPYRHFLLFFCISTNFWQFFKKLFSRGAERRAGFEP